MDAHANEDILNVAEKRKFSESEIPSSPVCVSKTSMAQIRRHDVQKSSLHARTYHQRLALVIMLRAYIMYKEKQFIQYIVTMEDPTGGKFDDIVLRYNLQKGEKGVIFIQCKHKQESGFKNQQHSHQKKPKQHFSIMKQAFLDVKLKKNPPYSIPMYFISFVENIQQPSKGDYFCLCTNAEIDEELKPYFVTRDPDSDLALFCCKDLDATFYQLNRSNQLPLLMKTLRDTSLEQLGMLLAKSIFQKTTISDDNPLINVYATLLERCVEKPLNEKYQAIENIYGFKAEFKNPDKTTAMEKLQKAFCKEYKVMMKSDPDIWSDVQEKGIRMAFSFTIHAVGDSFNLMNKPSSDYTKIDEKIFEFYKQFVLICATADGETLLNKAKDLLISVTDTEPLATLNELHSLTRNAMQNGTSNKINPFFFDRVLQRIKRSSTVVYQKLNAEQIIDSVIGNYSHIIIDKASLEKSSLFSFLRDESANVYQYRSTLDWKISCIIIKQTLTHFGNQYFLIDSKCLKQREDLVETIDDVCRYLNDVNYSKQNIITVVGTFDDEKLGIIEKKSLLHMRKIVTVEQISEQQLREDNEASKQQQEYWRVGDLEESVRAKLFEENEHLNMFGTRISLNKLIYETDSLTMLQNVLDLCATEQGNKSINEQSYDSIRYKYIQRNYEDYDPSKEIADEKTRETKIMFEDLSKLSVRKTLTFQEIANEIRNHSSVTAVQSALSLHDKSYDLPDFAKADSKQKVCIFLDEAGYGKSTYFTWLASSISSKQPSLYVIRMNAIEYSIDFDRLKETDLTNINNDELVRILYRFVHMAVCIPSANRYSDVDMKMERDEADRCAKTITLSDGQIIIHPISNANKLTTKQLIQLRIFQEKFNEKSLVLLFDGLDETIPDYKDVVMLYLSKVAKLERIQKLFLSSRPLNMHEEIKKTFQNCKIYRLEPFSSHNQILSLHKHLCCEMDDYKQCENDYQIVLLVIFHTILSYALEDVITAPLLLRMVFEAFLDVFKQHVNFSSKTVSDKLFIAIKLDILGLVENFVHQKWIIFTTEKMGVTDTSFKSTAARNIERTISKSNKQQHSLLALLVMFNNDVRNKLLSTSERLELNDIVQEADLTKIGIVIGYNDGIPLFMHRIFAEYYAACWLYDKREMLKCERFFHSQSFWMRSLDRVREFFDRMIVRELGKNVIHMAVLDRSMEQVTNLLNENKSLANDKDAGERLPLHLAHKHDQQSILKKLLEEMDLDLIDAKDNIFSWSALDYAFISGSKSAIKVLLEKGATVNLETLLAQIFSNDDDNLIMQVFNYAIWLTSAEDTKQVLKSFNERVVEFLINNRKVDIFARRDILENLSILDYCLKRKMNDIFEQFILKSDNSFMIKDYIGGLLKTAFGRKLYTIACFLIDECNCYPANEKSPFNLYAALKVSIESNRMKSFQIFLEQLCLLLNIPCANDEAIVIENDIKSLSLASLASEHLPKSCCVRSKDNVNLPIPEYDERNVINKEYVFESILAKAVHEGNVTMVSYIIQKFQKTITNRTIVVVMRLLPKAKRLLHDKSMLAFKYLLDKTTDLYSIDEHGRNLLHMTIQNGCFFMMHCLIEAKFDYTLSNTQKQWNIFHYAAASESKYNNRALKMYQYFIRLGDNDRFDVVDRDGNSVYDIAVVKSNFDIAKEMIESKYHTSEARAPILLYSLEKLNNTNELNIASEYLKYLSESDNSIWKEVRNIIRSH